MSDSENEFSQDSETELQSVLTDLERLALQRSLSTYQGLNKTSRARMRMDQVNTFVKNRGWKDDIKHRHDISIVCQIIPFHRNSLH